MASSSDSITENDISSVLFAPVSLEVVKSALKEEFPEEKVYIYTSGYNGARTVHLRGDEVDFEGYPDSTDGSGEDSDYLLNGMIAGEADAAALKAQSIFTRLMDSGMTVQFEVYDSVGNRLVEQKPTRR